MPERTSTAKESAPKVTSAPTEAASASEDTAPDIAVEDLIARADQFLGCASYVAAGALNGKSGELSIDEAKRAVESWLGSEVTKEG